MLANNIFGVDRLNYRPSLNRWKHCLGQALAARFFAIDLGLIVLAEFKKLAMVMLPLYLMFLTFFLSFKSSFKALIINLTVTFKPFHSWVVLVMSSPMDRPWRPGRKQLMTSLCKGKRIALYFSEHNLRT